MAVLRQVVKNEAFFYSLFILCTLLCFYHQFSTHQLIRQHNGNSTVTIARNRLSTNSSRVKPVEELACYDFMHSANCLERLAKSDGNHQINRYLLENTLDFSQILLIVAFNWPIYEGAPRIFNLYRQVFGKVVFCGPEDEDGDGHRFMETYRNFSGDGSALPKESFFVGYGQNLKGILIDVYWYKCLPLIIEANPNFQTRYSGVVIQGDDVVFNFWNAKIKYQKHFDQIWMNEMPSPYETQPMYPFEVDNKLECRGRTGNNSADCIKHHPWDWIDQNPEYTILFHDDLHRLSKIDSFWKGFENNLTQAFGGPRRLIGNLVDMVYIPSRVLPRINPIFKLLAKYLFFFQNLIIF